jgi:hypothetical protein
MDLISIFGGYLGSRHGKFMKFDRHNYQPKGSTELLH